MREKIAYAKDISDLIQKWTISNGLTVHDNSFPSIIIRVNCLCQFKQ